MVKPCQSPAKCGMPDPESLPLVPSRPGMGVPRSQAVALDLRLEHLDERNHWGELWLPVREKSFTTKNALEKSESAPIVATAWRCRPEASCPVACTVQVAV